jgi:preprotein translocase subunit SecG
VSKLLSVDGVTPEAEAELEALEGEDSVSTSVVALTVILVIIFVVLLAVLVVLLTKKEKPIEEVETSYY